MQNKDQFSNKSTETNAESVYNDRNSMENAKDYISGDSTPSSSGHQFSKLPTDTKHESKKPAHKTNS